MFASAAEPRGAISYKIFMPRMARPSRIPMRTMTLNSPSGTFSRSWRASSLAAGRRRLLSGY